MIITGGSDVYETLFCGTLTKIKYLMEIKGSIRFEFQVKSQGLRKKS